MGTELVTPIGRIIEGHPSEPQTKDMNGNALVYKSGPDAGKPRVNFFMGIAIEKTNAKWPKFYAGVQAEARGSFRNLFDQQTGQYTSHLPFAWKIIDGDSTEKNTKGVRWCDKPHYPGHWIVRLSNGFAPKLYELGGVREILDQKGIKRGDYVRVLVDVAGNEYPTKPGLFFNHKQIELVQRGDEIKGEMGYSDKFADNDLSDLPAGVTPMQPEPNAFASAPSTTPAASAVPTPLNTTYMDATHAAPSAPAPAPAAPTPPAPPLAEPRYTYQGAVYTLSQLVDAGWTPDQIAGLPPVA